MLDTNMCIYLIKNQPPQVAARFAQCLVGEVVMSAITLAELEYGVACSGENAARNRAALTALLEDIPAARVRLCGRPRVRAAPRRRS